MVHDCQKPTEYRFELVTRLVGHQVWLNFPLPSDVRGETPWGPIPLHSTVLPGFTRDRPTQSVVTGWWFTTVKSCQSSRLTRTSTDSIAKLERKTATTTSPRTAVSTRGKTSPSSDCFSAQDQVGSDLFSAKLCLALSFRLTWFYIFGRWQLNIVDAEHCYKLAH